MKNIKSLGMEEMTKQEAMATNGGLNKAILFCLEAVESILDFLDFTIDPIIFPNGDLGDVTIYRDNLE